MAPRTTWKGHLKLSLVTCPIRLYNAVSASSRVSFNLLHKDTHNRIQMRPYDPELGLVERADLVKGYQYEKDQYVILEDEDFEKVQIESTKTISIERFVDEKEVDFIYLDAPYYLAPDGPVAEETFVVIREAMTRQKKVALSRLVLSNREHPIALSPRDKGMLLMTLRSAHEVREQAQFFDDIGGEKPDKEMLELATQLIKQRSGRFEPSEFRDRYQEALLELVKAKVKGQEPVVARQSERGKVINLMDALRRSLEEEKKPAAESKRRKAAGGRAGQKKQARGGRR